VAAAAGAAAAISATGAASAAATADLAAAAATDPMAGTTTGAAADAPSTRDDASDPLAAGMPDDIDEMARPSWRSLAEDLCGKDNAAIR
jgi:hypothetical protein